MVFILINNFKKIKGDKMKRKQISLPTLKEIGFVFLALFFLILTYLNFVNLFSEWTSLGLNQKPSNFTGKQLLIIPYMVSSYLFICGIAVSIVMIIKQKLKEYQNQIGLIGGLIFGLIVGLIWGLIWGLIVGLISEFE